MQIEQPAGMDARMRQELRELLGEPAAHDDYRAIFDRKGPTDITPVRRMAKESGKVTTVSLHEPGEIVTMSDGRQYEVQDNGQWRRINPK